MYSICVYITKVKPNNRFNLINPLSWFLREDYARTTPSPPGADFKVKRMLARPFGRNTMNEIFRQIKIDKMYNSLKKITFIICIEEIVNTGKGNGNENLETR